MGQDFMHLSYHTHLLIYSYFGIVHWPVVFLRVQSVNILLGLHGIGRGIWDWEMTIMMIDDGGLRNGHFRILEKEGGLISFRGKPSR